MHQHAVNITQKLLLRLFVGLACLAVFVYCSPHILQTIIWIMRKQLESTVSHIIHQIKLSKKTGLRQTSLHMP